ncbi:MAG: hypothetical protein QW197_02995 [Candidatus Aenigmatarchaeota archaeon]
MDNFVKELDKLIFEEDDCEKALKIAKKANEYINGIDSIFERWELKLRFIKLFLGFTPKYPPKTSLESIVGIVCYFHKIFGWNKRTISEIYKQKNILIDYGPKYIDIKIHFLLSLGFHVKDIANYMKNKPYLLLISPKKFFGRISYALSKGYEPQSLHKLFILIRSKDEKYIQILQNLGYNADLNEYKEFLKSKQVEEIIKAEYERTREHLSIVLETSYNLS